jgi:hypothetical protein
VDVAHARAEGARERAPPDNGRDHGLNDRPRREEIALALQDELVGDTLGDQRANAVVSEGRRGAVGKLIGVNRGPIHIADQEGEEDRHGRDHDEHRHGHACAAYSHATVLPARICGSGYAPTSTPPIRRAQRPEPSLPLAIEGTS